MRNTTHRHDKRMGKIRNTFCTVSTILNNKERITDFINYNLNLGVGHMFIFLDKTEVDFVNYDDDRVTIIPMNKQFISAIVPDGKALDYRDKQNAAIRTGIELAKEKGYEFISSIDIDELMVFEEPIEDLLKNMDYLNADALRMYLFELYPEDGTCDGMYDETIFKKKIPGVRVKDIDKDLDNTFMYRGHVKSKYIYRTNLSVSLHGAHMNDPYDRPNVLIETTKVKLYHYYGYSLQEFLDKYAFKKTLLKRGRTGEKIKRIIRRIEKANGDPKKLEELYIETHILTPRDKAILTKQDLLVTFIPDKELFKDARLKE